jgi:HPt (histidine-containing phosphotransfer) domain-containing protein
MTIAGMDAARGLAMTGGTEAGFRQVLAVFRKDASERLKLLQKTPQSQDLPHFTTQVHALKSASASIGAAEISAEAARLEEAGKKADLAFIAEFLPAFAARLEALVDSISAALKQTNSTTAVENTADTSRAAAFAQLVSELKTALTENNTETIDRLLEALLAQTRDTQTRQTLERVSDAVLMAEFDDALKILETLEP